MSSSKSNYDFVIQCARCKSIIGDSSNYHSCHERNNMIILNSTINTKTLSDVMDTKVELYVVQSNNIGCCECGKTIGKYYLTTPEPVNYLLNRFSFSMNEILCYVIGWGNGSPFQSDLRFLKHINALEIQPTNDDNHVTRNFADDDIPKTALTSVNTEIDKIQVVLMDVLYRLSSLEANSMAINGDDDTLTQGTSKKKRN